MLYFFKFHLFIIGQITMVVLFTILFNGKIGLSAHPTLQSYRTNKTVLYNCMTYFSSVLYLRTQDTDDTVFESNIDHKNGAVTAFFPSSKP
jgi:hypothetical protein